jgi:hypothetical protein
MPIELAEVREESAALPQVEPVFGCLSQSRICVQVRFMEVRQLSRSRCRAEASATTAYEDGSWLAGSGQSPGAMRCRAAQEIRGGRLGPLGVLPRSSPTTGVIMVIIFLMRNSQAGGRWCSETEVRQIIGTDGAEALIGVISGGWQAYLDERRVRSRRTRANVVWDQMIDIADRDLVTGFEGVRPVSIYGSTAYVFNDRLLLRFKKHDRKMRTSNVLTAVQDVLARQGYLDGMPDLAHVTCGYVLDKAEAGIEKCVVVRATARKRKPDWVIDLADLAAGNIAPVQLVLPGLDGQAEQVAPLPSIRRRDKASDQ